MQRKFRWMAVLGVCLAALSGCRREADRAPQGAATRPAQALQLLTRHLRANDLEAFARDAVPPELHARLVVAWREGRTRWPLDELPFDQRLPQVIAALSAPGSEATLQASFDRQFARADSELRAAAASLGLFGVQYVQNGGNFSQAERLHYAQFIEAISRWGMRAPLGDPQRARRAIALLARAARRTGLGRESDFARYGMQDSLRRLAPFVATGKQALAQYGLDLDASLAGLQAGLEQQTGDTARVRMRYLLGGQPIDAVVEVERIDGRWYLSDYLRHAETAVAVATAPRAVQPAAGPPSP